MKASLYPLFLCAGLALMPTVAAADTAPAPIPGEPDALGFATLDRGGDYAGGGLFLSLTDLRDSLYHYVDDYGTYHEMKAAAFRADLYLQKVGAHGWGAYLQLPTTKLMMEDNGINASTRLISGNIELGALRAMRLDELDVVFRAGASLPNSNRRTAVLVGGYGRLGDLYTEMPRTGWARLSASPTARRGLYFGRVDVGVDVRAWTDPDWGQATLPRFVGRLGLGVGRDLGPATAALEVVNVGVFGDAGDTLREHTLAATVRWKSVFPRLYLSVAAPLGEARGDLFVVTFGVQMVVPPKEEPSPPARLVSGRSAAAAR